MARFHIVGMAFRIRENHEMGRAKALPFRCHHDHGIDKAASLLLLSSAKASNTKDLLNKQTCQGILCISTQSPNIHPYNDNL